LHRYYDIFNAYDGINNLYTVNANAGIAPVAVSQDIIDLILAARDAYEITGGMTNIAMGPILRIWHEYRSHGMANPEYATLPCAERLKEAAQFMDMRHVIIDEQEGTVFLELPGMCLDVGSVAKGFAAYLAMEAGAEAGMETMLISAGGHVVAMGYPPGRGFWNIGVANPDGGEPSHVDTLRTTNRTVSTSSGNLRYFTVDGQSLGHIVDPTTLHPAGGFKQVVVVHPVSWMADVLSTALFILPLDEGRDIAERAGAEALWIDMNDEWTYTDGYEALRGN